MSFIVFGLILAVASVIVLTQLTNKKVIKVNPALRGLIAVGILLGTGLLGAMRNVGAGEVGIVYAPFQGGVQEDTLPEGTHFINPLNSVYTIQTTQQQIQFAPFSVQTSDAEWAEFLVEIKYRIPIENAYKVYRTFKGMPSSSLLRTDVQTSIKQYGSKYNVYDILGGEYEKMRLEAFNDLQETLNQYGIQLDELNFIDIDAGEIIENAIIQKGVIKQEKEQAEQRQQIAEIEAETNLIKAENEKQLEILRAQAEAEKQKIAAQQEAENKRILAEAEAEALRLIQDQLATNPEIIEYLLAMAWDGKLPETWLQSGDSPFDIIVSPK